MANQRRLEKDRTALHSTITQYFRFTENRRADDLITLEWCESALDRFLQLDLELGNESADAYYQRIAYVKAYLQNKAEDDRQAAAEAARAAQLQQEEDQERAEARQHRQSLRAAELAAVQASSTLNSTFSTQHRPRPKEAKPDYFDGKPSSYHSFVRSFELAYENNGYEVYDQFTIFKTLVGDHGRHLLANLEPTADGLKTAKERMKATFCPPSRVRQDILNQLKALPEVKSSCNTTALTSLLFTFEKGVKALEDSNTEKGTIDITYLPLVTSKLPIEILAKYQEKHNSPEHATFITFLRKHIADFEVINEMRGISLSESTSTRPKAKIHSIVSSPSATNSSTQARPPSAPRNQSSRTGPTSPPKCVFCDGPHSSFFCDRTDVRERRRIAREKQLCFVCLRTGHPTRRCTSTYQCRCGERHSRALCLATTTENVQAASGQTANIATVFPTNLPPTNPPMNSNQVGYHSSPHSPYLPWQQQSVGQPNFPLLPSLPTVPAILPSTLHTPSADTQQNQSPPVSIGSTSASVNSIVTTTRYSHYFNFDSYLMVAVVIRRF